MLTLGMRSCVNHLMNCLSIQYKSISTIFEELYKTLSVDMNDQVLDMTSSHTETMVITIQ